MRSGNMAEVSFAKEIESLRLGAGETFYGEGILAVTKALLQSGVAYVGGYQGAPVSHLLDVLVQSEGLLGDLGIHLETCTNEAAAAAMLGASINYPLRGAVTWKSIVGTNVAADALSNLASPGVQGGALIIVGEDYGEGASVIQERTHAFALKSSLWLIDPRPDLPTMVRAVEKGFELSELSNTPVILELRIRACHMFGSFLAKDNVAARYSTKDRLAPAGFNYDRLSHPPATFRQEADKIARRLPAAQKFIRDHGLNERMGPADGDIGIIVQGGLFNVLNGRLALAGLSDVDGTVSLPTLVLNVVHPLVPDEITSFCAGKKAVLIIEEGAPDFLEQAIGQILRKADLNTRLFGKDLLPMAGEYTPLVVGKGLAAFCARYGRVTPALDQWVARVDAQKAEVDKALGAPLPARPPTFCTGCPERPVFSAMKLLRRETGPVHVAADIGCHSFATFAPFSQGNSILGYGMSLASAAAVSGTQQTRPISVMGDGGFWHNGLITGVAGAVFNKDDSVLVVMNNGYSSATGQQDILSSKEEQDGRGKGLDIEAALKSLGVPWIRRVRTYGVRGRGQHPARGTAHGTQGPQGHHRRRRMPARAPAPHPSRAREDGGGRQARRAHPLLGRPGGVHGRPLLHPPLRLPLAHHQAQRGPAAHRPDRARQQRLRRLRAVRRGLACRAALPLVRADRHHPEPDYVGPPAAQAVGGADPSLRRRAHRQARAGAGRVMRVSEARHIRLLIAALGGEGGGVLASWLHHAAIASGHFVQGTYIPGVAQRTGATTYYLELVPGAGARHSSSAARPVLALNAAPGEVDLVVASELLEATRTIGAGFVTPDRTHLIASSARVFTVDEKAAMGDGRLDQARMLDMAERFSRRATIADFAAVATRAGSPLNAVLLGAIAASGVLPIAADAFRAAIRAEGKAVDANLRGFEAGLQGGSTPLPARAVRVGLEGPPLARSACRRPSP